MFSSASFSCEWISPVEWVETMESTGNPNVKIKIKPTLWKIFWGVGNAMCIYTNQGWLSLYLFSCMSVAKGFLQNSTLNNFAHLWPKYHQSGSCAFLNLGSILLNAFSYIYTGWKTAKENLSMITYHILGRGVSWWAKGSPHLKSILPLTQIIVAADSMYFIRRDKILGAPIFLIWSSAGL